MYNMISQRDSRLNISVAEDSKKIAAAAKRDSLAMKTVSMLTLIFLPGTFVAVILPFSFCYFLPFYFLPKSPPSPPHLLPQNTKNQLNPHPPPKQQNQQTPPSSENTKTNKPLTPKKQAIFSAGIFHFERASTNIVSDLWWVYFVVSGLLTLVTVGVWLLYMRWRSSGIRQEEEAVEKLLV